MKKHVPYTTIRFGHNTQIARLFAKAARYRDYKAQVNHADVTVYDAKPYEASQILKEWALNRGSLPDHVFVDWGETEVEEA